MDKRIEQVIHDLRQASADATSLFATFDGKKLNWKPSEKGWSIAQCLEHIILSNELFFPEFDKLASGQRSNSFWENWSPFTKIGGKFLVNAVSIDSKKAKAPSKKVVPQTSDLSSDIIEQFAVHIEALTKKVASVESADREKTIVTSPFLAIFTYSLEDAFTVLVEHTRRHVRQAKRVSENSEFPA